MPLDAKWECLLYRKMYMVLGWIWLTGHVKVILQPYVMEGWDLETKARPECRMGKTLEFSSWELRAKGCRLGLPSTEPELEDEGIQWQVVYRWMHEEIYRYVYEGTCGRSKGMLRCFVCSVQKRGWFLRLSPIQVRMDSSGPSLVCEEALKTWWGLEWTSVAQHARKTRCWSLEVKWQYGFRGGAIGRQALGARCFDDGTIPYIWLRCIHVRVFSSTGQVKAHRNK